MPSTLLRPLGFSNLTTALISVQPSRTLQFHGWNMILESSNISKYSIDFRVDMMIKWFLFVIVFCDHICILNTDWLDFWIYLRVEIDFLSIKNYKTFLHKGPLISLIWISFIQRGTPMEKVFSWIAAKENPPNIFARWS